MPHRQPIDELRARLRQAMSLRSTDTAQHWGNSKAMHEMLLSIQRDLGGQADTKPPEDQVKASLLQFHKTRELPSFNNLKYVCYGITVPIGIKQWRVIDDEPLFDSLLSEVRKRQTQAKQFRRCYQGLLESYFSFNRQGQGSNYTQTNWTGLKSFLADNLSPVLSTSSSRGQPPEWLSTLAEHRNLLGDDPCSRYAAGFMRDDTSEFRAMCSALGIPGSSWVWEDALMAYVRSVCSSQDEVFKRRIPNLLELVNGKLDMKLPKIHATEAVAVVVSRYARCEDKPEHAGLLNASMEWIGNPWVKRTAWDAVVRNEPARKMVESWLKRRLIKDFFELLAEDGSANIRRLQYWLRWEPQISDMWFVLGVDALENSSPAFVDLRRQMGVRARMLGDNNPGNNAFIMRIGDLIVIEYGLHGNACYAFSASDFKVNLDKKYLEISELRQKTGATRLIHRDTKSYKWEVKFDYELRELLRDAPFSRTTTLTFDSEGSGYKEAPPTSVVVRRDPAPSSEIKARNKLSQRDFELIQTLCNRLKLEWEDNRASGGALWVLMPDRFRHPKGAEILEKIGFRYREGRGFWFKDSN
jgi:hypothetical protein